MGARPVDITCFLRVGGIGEHHDSELTKLRHGRGQEDPRPLFFFVVLMPNNPILWIEGQLHSAGDVFLWTTEYRKEVALTLDEAG